jgi:hypothetical protein
MLYKKFQALAQIVGFVTIGLLTLLGVLSLFNGGSPALAAIGLAPAAPQATAPEVMNYQGILKDADGEPLDGMYTMTFRIYDSESGGSVLWEETHTNVTVREGRFNVLLGYSDPLSAALFSQPDRYIGVTVAPYAEMSPRQRFASAPYAFHADHTARAYGLSASDGDPVDAVTVDGTGNVAIGDGSTSANVEISKGGLCVDSDGACSPPGDGGLRVGDGGIHGADSSGQDLYLVPDSGYVGIGTTSPDKPLTVQGTGANSEWISFKDTSGATQWHLNYYMASNPGLNLAETGASEGRLFLENGGNVGIGTTSPSEKLDVNGNIAWSGHLASMMVTTDYEVASSGEGSQVQQMVLTDNSICFLTGVIFADIDDTLANEYGVCDVYQSGGYWVLQANSVASKDNYAWCEARCLQW